MLLRSSKYLNNLIEQDHRRVKHRLGPMLGSKSFRTAAVVIGGIELAEKIKKSADTLDEVQHASERELAIRNLNRNSKLLRSVRSALRRIGDGSFGTCLHCKEEISPKRLAAVPWAPYCIQGQEQADRNLEDVSEKFEEMFVNAA